jgi:hypothetical protein
MQRGARAKARTVPPNSGIGEMDPRICIAANTAQSHYEADFSVGRNCHG